MASIYYLAVFTDVLKYQQSILGLVILMLHLLCYSGDFVLALWANYATAKIGLRTRV